MSRHCRAPDCKYVTLRHAERTKHELTCYKFKTLRKQQKSDGMKRIAEEMAKGSGNVKRRRIDTDDDTDIPTIENEVRCLFTHEKLGLSLYCENSNRFSTGFPSTSKRHRK
jgi:hypothetical protein